MIPYKNRNILFDEKVEIYRCLNRKGYVFSIRQNGKVVAHTESIVLKDCDLIVNNAGKKNCIKTKQRNVHAFVKGFITNKTDIKLTFSFILKYNPFSPIGFHTQGENEIKKANVVYIQENQIYCQL